MHITLAWLSQLWVRGFTSLARVLNPGVHIFLGVCESNLTVVCVASLEKFITVYRPVVEDGKKIKVIVKSITLI